MLCWLTVVPRPSSLLYTDSRGPLSTGFSLPVQTLSAIGTGLQDSLPWPLCRHRARAFAHAAPLSFPCPAPSIARKHLLPVAPKRIWNQFVPKLKSH